MNTRISPHHRDILNALAHGAQMEISAALRTALEPDDMTKALHTIRLILEKLSREAYNWGKSYRDALPDKPVRYDIPCSLDLGPARPEDTGDALAKAISEALTEEG